MQIQNYGSLGAIIEKFLKKVDPDYPFAYDFVDKE
jgi:hypothetical protein